MTFLVIRAIVFSVSAILTFKVSASTSTYVLYFFYLGVKLNSWVSIDVACFNFDAPVCPVAVESPIYLSPGRYTFSPTKKATSPKSEISYPAKSRVRSYLPSSEASSYSVDSWVIPDVVEGYLAGTILRPGVDAVFFHACGFLPIRRDLLAIFTVSSSLPYAWV